MHVQYSFNSKKKKKSLILQIKKEITKIPYGPITKLMLGICNVRYLTFILLKPKTFIYIYIHDLKTIVEEMASIRINMVLSLLPILTWWKVERLVSRVIIENKWRWKKPLMSQLRVVGPA